MTSTCCLFIAQSEDSLLLLSLYFPLFSELELFFLSIIKSAKSFVSMHLLVSRHHMTASRISSFMVCLSTRNCWLDNNLTVDDDGVAEQQCFWRITPGNHAIEELKECYEEIVFSCKNLIMLPKGSSGIDYIKEITSLINEWLIGSPIRKCAMYALHVMPALLLQKPSNSSKSKYLVAALKRRLQK